MDDSLKKTAEFAYQCFRAGWATGNWEPYIEMLADDFTFQFPGIKLTDATYLRMGSV